MLFFIGQPVICVNDDFAWARKYYSMVHNYPTKGGRYIVRRYACRGSHPALCLREMTNPRVIYQDGILREAGFWEKRFKPAPLPEAITSALTTGVKEEEYDWDGYAHGGPSSS